MIWPELFFFFLFANHETRRRCSSSCLFARFYPALRETEKSPSQASSDDILSRYLLSIPYPLTSSTEKGKNQDRDCRQRKKKIDIAAFPGSVPLDGCITGANLPHPCTCSCQAMSQLSGSLGQSWSIANKPPAISRRAFSTKNIPTYRRSLTPSGICLSPHVVSAVVLRGLFDCPPITRPL